MGSGIFPARQKPCGGSGVLSQFAPALRSAVVERACFLLAWKDIRRVPGIARIDEVAQRPPRQGTGAGEFVAQVFLPAGLRDFPVPCSRAFRSATRFSVRRNWRLESRQHPPTRGAARIRDPPSPDRQRPGGTGKRRKARRQRWRENGETTDCGAER